MKCQVLIMCILFVASCDEWVDQIKDLRSDYANPRFHENGIAPETPHNAEIGKDWMDNVFYAKWPMRTITKPNGCSNFDKIYYVSTYGSDTNSGQSATPFATVQKAIDIASNDELPSSFNSSFPIGAFNDNFRCKDFNWLLGKD